MHKLLFDFSDPSAVDAWRAIDDRVMGGISRSQLRHDPTAHAVFEGLVSLEQNGGFASVRALLKLNLHFQGHCFLYPYLY
jgi:hypothetical protein